MFYLRTGANGSCKTLFTLRDIRDLQIKTGRPVAFNTRFKAGEILTKEFGWKLLPDFKKWQDEPDGTIFLIDEAYNDLPVRPNGQQPPEYIARLAEHRARGFDFFLLALHPSTIDSFVRKAIGAPGWHQHLKRVGGASSLTRVFQWDAVNPNCEKEGSGKTAQITNRLQPKEVYSWYDSAFIHTGKVRIPKQVWWLVGGILVAVVLGVFAYKNISKKFSPPADAVGAPMVPASAARVQGNDRAKPLTTSEFVALETPRIPGLLHTAPAYDQLTTPKRVPLPAACVESKSNGCKCYTQDATPYATDALICHQIAHGGIFLAFIEPVQDSPRRESKLEKRESVPAPGRLVSEAPDPFKTLDALPLNPRAESRSTVDRDVQAMTLSRRRSYVQ